MSNDADVRGPSDIANEPKVQAVDFEEHRFTLHLDDGRTLGVPLEWYPQLRDATPAARGNWQPRLHGLYVHWPTLDLTLLVSALLKSRGPVGSWEWDEHETS
jgi:hypothetical protein